MSHVLRQSTQVIVRIGPFMDAADAVTPETGVTLGAADQAEALKAAGAATADISGNTWAAITGAGGWYDLTLTTTDTNTIGDLTIAVQDTSVCLPVFARFQVIEEAAYDTIYAASALPASTTNITAGTIATVTNQLTAAAIATGVWQDATAGDFTTASSIGKALYVSNVVPGAAGGHFIAGTNAATTITTGLTTTFTGNLTGSVASVTGLTAADVGAIKTKTDFLPSATAGAAGGVFIAGTNAATTITTALTTTFTGNLTGSVASLTTNNDKTGYRLSATGVDDIHDEVVDGTLTLRTSVRLQNAPLGGKLSGAGTGTETIRNPDDTKDRVVATVDSSGNRTAITTDLT